MKKTLLPILTIAGVFALVSNANAATNTANATVTSKAKILTGINIIGTDLMFGDVAAGSTGGTIVVPTSGAASVTGDLVFLNGTGHATATPSILTITGQPSSLVTLSIPTSSTVYDTTNEDNTLSVSGHNVSLNSGETVASVEIPESGSRTIPLGATLTVPGTAVPGGYEGTFTVTVQYN